MAETTQFKPPIDGGSWGVAVSGGADSVALLRLVHGQVNLQLRVLHLNHELRGQESDGDECFVRELSKSLGVACDIAKRSRIEAEMGRLNANPAARYRAARHVFFAQSALRHNLDGVLVAHQADDVAETIFQRLARGSGIGGLTGIPSVARAGPLLIRRPLLHCRAKTLREYLSEIGQPWREDVSNEADTYQRNRVRKLLIAHPGLTELLLQLAHDARAASEFAAQHAPRLAESFTFETLASLPDSFAEVSAKRWLMDKGVQLSEARPDVVARLLMMARDRASPARQHFPGRIEVTRHKGEIRGS